MRRLDLDGVLVPITTPLRSDELALDALEENILRLSRTDLRGFLVLGSTGESVGLDERESAAILETARRVIPESRVMIAGATAESTRGAVARGELAARIGADAVLIGIPIYFAAQIDDAALWRHYATIADRLEIPVLLYSVPKFTRRALTVELVERLAAHPGIIGIKESGESPERLAALLPAPERPFDLLSGHGPSFARAVELGYTGGILAVANVDPDLCCALHRAVREGERAAVERLQGRMERLSAALAATGIGGIKQAMEWRGLFGGAPRPPLRSPDAAAQQTLRRQIEPVMTPGPIGGGGGIGFGGGGRDGIGDGDGNGASHAR